MSKMVLRNSSSQLSHPLILMERRNLKLVVEMVTGPGHWLKHMLRMGIFVDETTSRKCGQAEERLNLAYLKLWHR